MAFTMLKVPGGKLLKAEGVISEGRIERIKITGDFFLHPEEAIERLEEALIGTPIEPSSVLSTIRFSLEGAELIGATNDDIAELIMKLNG